LEGLKPYLTGQKQISVNGAGQGLFAAISIQRAGQAVSIAYWSANLIDMEPRRRVGEAMAARMRVQALTAAGLTLEETNAISNLSPTISHFDPRQGAAAGQVGSKDRAPYLVATLMAVALWSAVIGVANMLLTGVVEEKSNKILDQLLTRASPLQILIGKLLGVAMVSATLFAVWGGLGFGVTHLVAGAAPQGSLSAFIGAAFSPDLLVTFALCFVAGYLMFGALFLGLGALCDSLQEAQSLLGPVVFLLIPPILLVGPAIDNPNSPVVAMASWAPLFAPFVLMMRAPSDLAPIEIVGPALVMAIFTLFVLVAAARLFRAGAVDQLSAAAFKRALWPFGGNSKAAINK
jgi:ABC-2 type transport system permease protein